MNRKILCLGFDGVINSYSSGWKGATNISDPPVEGALKFMAEALYNDWDVVIHSSRARYWGGIRAMRKWLKHHAGALWWDSPGYIGLEYVRFVRWKPSAVVTIDDRALTFVGEWPTFEQLNKFKPWNKNVSEGNSKKRG